MSSSQHASVGAAPRSFRRLLLVVAILGIAIVGVILALFVPYGSTSYELQVSSSVDASTNLTIPHAGWVTVHFDHVGMMGMRYWMEGPTGMMFDHSMMNGGYSFSYWSWGGTYHCGVSYSGPEMSPHPVWMNATWGIL